MLEFLLKKLQAFWPVTFFKEWFLHRCFPLNFVEFIRTFFISLIFVYEFWSYGVTNLTRAPAFLILLLQPCDKRLFDSIWIEDIHEEKNPSFIFIIWFKFCLSICQNFKLASVKSKISRIIFEGCYLTRCIILISTSFQRVETKNLNCDHSW